MANGQAGEDWQNFQGEKERTLGRREAGNSPADLEKLRHTEKETRLKKKKSHVVECRLLEGD